MIKHRILFEIRTLHKVVTGAYDLYKNLDPTKLIKGTMKVRVCPCSSLNFERFQLLMRFAFCLLCFQLAKAGIDHARREMARGSADSIGFFLTLSAEVTIINNGKLQEPFISNESEQQIRLSSAACRCAMGIRR